MWPSLYLIEFGPDHENEKKKISHLPLAPSSVCNCVYWHLFISSDGPLLSAGDRLSLAGVLEQGGKFPIAAHVCV